MIGCQSTCKLKCDRCCLHLNCCFGLCEIWREIDIWRKIDKKKHQSGSFKRKVKERKEKLLASCPRLTTYFSSSTSQHDRESPTTSTANTKDEASSSGAAQNTPTEPEDQQELSTTLLPGPTEVPPKDSVASSSSGGNVAPPGDAPASDSIGDPPAFDSIGPGSAGGHLGTNILSQEEYPTDPYLFRNRSLTPEVTRALIEHGPCQRDIDIDKAKVVGKFAAMKERRVKL